MREEESKMKKKLKPEWDESRMAMTKVLLQRRAGNQRIKKGG